MLSPRLFQYILPTMQFFDDEVPIILNEVHQLKKRTTRSAFLIAKIEYIFGVVHK